MATFTVLKYFFYVFVYMPWHSKYITLLPLVLGELCEQDDTENTVSLTKYHQHNGFQQKSVS